jgi:ankyrin repeat protein
MKSFYLHPFQKSRNMNRYPITGYVLGILIVLVLAGCRGQTGGKEEQKQEHEQEQDESWHMTDEIKQTQAGPAEEEAFRMAAHEGKLEQLKNLHAQGVACDAPDQDGHTALMFAAFNGHSEIVIYLLDAGAEIDRTDYLGRTALLYGATGPFPETVKILLDRGADPNRVDSDEHFSPLMHAAAEGHLEVVKVLIAYGADRSLKDVDGDDAAAFAAQSGHRQVAEYLKSLSD